MVPKDHITHILVGFIAVLGAFTALKIIGVDGSDSLHDVLLALGGALAGIAVSKPPVP